MKETQSTPKDKIENVRQVEVQKQLLLSKKIIPYKGHTLFEVNKVTGQVVKAEYKEVKDIPFTANKSPFKQVTKMKVIMRENCIYISALNIKNCFKQLGYVVKK